MKRRERRHRPVLLKEVLRVLDPRSGGIVVDCTVGLGGHAVAILPRLGPRGLLIGMDLDASNLATAREALGEEGVELHHGNFAGLPAVLAGRRADGVLADLGVSSPHIDDPARGFSYRVDGPLDMRMDASRGRTASELLDRMTEGELAEALAELGDEEDAARIARLVVRRRPVRTTAELTAIVCEARRFTLERAAGAKLHPAARTFQALRMLVNREAANLERLLTVLPECLRPGGKAAVISFHSGEDRRVKRAFREGFRRGVWTEVAEEPVTAGEAEIEANPRSRSAKLRWAVRA